MICFHSYGDWSSTSRQVTTHENYVGTYIIQQHEEIQTKICKKCDKSKTRVVVLSAKLIPTGRVRVSRVEDY